MNYYEILGLTPEAKAEEIKKAYRKLAMQHHPDRNSGEKNSEEEFKKINEAYSTLSDPDKKKNYDFSLHNTGFNGNPGATGFNFHGNFSEDDINDLMRNMFRQHTGRPDFDDIFGFHRARTQRIFSINLTFWEAIFGVEKSFNMIRNVSGTNKNFTINVHFPPGINDGEIVEVNIDNEITHVQVHIVEDERFVRDNLDLYTEVDIPMTLAALGGKFVFPHWSGDLEINIPEGLQNGQKLRLANAGIKREVFNGDLYLICNIVIPKKMTKKQKELLQQFSKLEKNNTNTVFDSLKKTWNKFKKN